MSYFTSKINTSHCIYSYISDPFYSFNRADPPAENHVSSFWICSFSSLNEAKWTKQTVEPDESTLHSMFLKQFFSRMAIRPLHTFLCCRNPVVTVFSGGLCGRLYFHHTAWCKGTSQPKCSFRPAKVAVVTKTTRYEFEQQRYLYAGLSEEDLKQLVRATIFQI